MYGLMNIIIFRQRIIFGMISVSVSSALSVCSYSDYTDNSLRALSKLFMCKSCTDNLSVGETDVQVHTWWQTNAKDRPSLLYRSEPVHSSFAETSVCRSVIPRLCESRSLSHRLETM